MLGIKFNNNAYKTLITSLTASVLISSNIALATEPANPKAYFKLGDWGIPQLQVDEKTYSRSFFEPAYQEAEHAFDHNPEAAKEFKNYIDNTNTSNYLLWGTLGSAFLFASLGENQWRIPRREFVITWDVMMVSGIISSLYFSGLAGHSLGKAINIYNGFEKASNSEDKDVRLSFSPVILSRPTSTGSQTGAGIGLALSF